MELNHETADMLDLMSCPAFCVKNHIITKVNQPASTLLIQEGTTIDSLILNGGELYCTDWEGSLYVTLSMFGCEFGAAVHRAEDMDVFTIDQETAGSTLRAFSLAALELRSPLTDAIAAAQKMDGSAASSQLRRSLFQLLRIVCNMSDAGGTGPAVCMECRDVDALLREVFEKASALTENTGVTLRYEGLRDPALTAADGQMLERAVLNMISNAIKFTSKGGSIHAGLTRHGNFLLLQVCDNGTGIPETIRGTVFRRHMRQPAIEDGRHGIGLGMLLIRNAAAMHGGAVLIDHPKARGTRITMTIAIRPVDETLRQSPFHIDYAGELDHALIELADCLDASKY